MQDVLKIAVAKAVKDKLAKEASKGLNPGTYQVDAVVRIIGTFTKGKDYETLVPSKIPWPVLCALLASKLNQTTLDSVMAEFGGALGSGDLAKLGEGIKEKAQAVVNEVKGQTRTTATGKIKASLVAEPVAVTAAERIGD